MSQNILYLTTLCVLMKSVTWIALTADHLTTTKNINRNSIWNDSNKGTNINKDKCQWIRQLGNQYKLNSSMLYFIFIFDRLTKKKLLKRKINRIQILYTYLICMCNYKNWTTKM